MKMTVTTKTKKVRINFREAHTIYRNKKGEKVVGTTTAIGLRDKPGLVGWAHKKGLDGEELYEKDRGAKVGTVTHARIEAYFGNYEIDNYNITPEAWNLSNNCMNSFMEWVVSKDFKPILIEKEMISEKYQYGGKFDWYGKLNGRLTVIDFKTKAPNIYETDIYQLAAYSQMLKEHNYKLEKATCLNIHKSLDDSYVEQTYSVNDLGLQFQAFLRLKELWQIEYKIKQNIKGVSNA